MTVSDDEQLLDVQQVADWLNVEPRYVYQLASSGALLRVRVGRYVRIPAGSVRAYIKANTVEASAAPVRARRPGARRHLRKAG
ncbi:MAG TPA: helix-turn-helix domain-containing protein [Trebonia sp.]|jgi:excisionase family DNA binding protein